MNPIDIDTSVLVVGSGPSGLVLALSLLQNGIRVRIIEKKPHYPLGQRGAGIQPRSYDVHKVLGTLPDIIAKGVPLVPMHLYAPPEGTKLIKVINVVEPIKPTPSVPYSNALMLGQNNQEAILRAHIAKYSCEVELATELTSFEQFDDHVVAQMIKTTENGERVEETIRCQYLVGADGAHSTVRKQVGIKFLGETREEVNIILGDIQVLKGLSKDNWPMWGNPAVLGTSLRATEDGNIYSLIASQGPQSQLPQFGSQRAVPTREELIELVYTTSGRRDIEFGELVFVGNYRPNIRMVDKFSKGRVFVVGDAAHAHSPTGGQGTNSSIQDSFNLGWKLALAVQGLSPSSILDTFTAERLPVIAEMLNLTTNLFNKTMENFAGDEIWKRGGALNQLGVNCRGSPIVVDERTPWDETNPSPAYGNTFGGIVCAGDRAPDAPGLGKEDGEKTSLYDVFGSSYHTVLVFAGIGTENVAGSVLEAISLYPKDRIRTATILPSGHKLEIAAVNTHTLLEDGDGHAYEGYSVLKERPTIVVVRPDATVGAVVFGVEGLNRYFKGIFT